LFVRREEDDGFIVTSSASWRSTMPAGARSSDCSTNFKGKDAPMTNPDLTLIAALLDRSGSMEDCKKATESGSTN
jgi:hypothetical protein